MVLIVMPGQPPPQGASNFQALPAGVRVLLRIACLCLVNTLPFFPPCPNYYLHVPPPLTSKQDAGARVLLRIFRLRRVCTQGTAALGGRPP